MSLWISPSQARADVSVSDLYTPSQPLPNATITGAAPSQEGNLRRRLLLLPAWLLPAMLIVAFAALFAFVFRDRLLPALPVNVAPAILLADIEQEAAALGADKPAGDPAAAPVSAPALAPTSSTMLFQAAGWFEPDPLPIFATTLTDGVISQVHVLEGQEVKKGQLLAELIADDAKIAVDAAQRAHDKAAAELKLQAVQVTVAQAEADVMADQVKAAEAKLAEEKDNEHRIARIPSGSVSDQERSRAKFVVQGQMAEVASRRSQLTAATAKVEAARAQTTVMEASVASALVEVEKQKLALSRTRITSPVDGVILQLHAAPGQKKLLAMDDHQSATIATLFEKGKLQARVDVPLADARGLTAGQQAIVTSDFLPNTEFRGVVSRIVGSADLQRNTLQAKVRILEPDPRLRPEMLCRVKFLSPSNTNAPPTTSTPSTSHTSGASDPTRAVMIPEAAMIPSSNPSAPNAASAWVIAADGVTATKRTLQPGTLKHEDHVAIDSGILPGELVILPPHDQLTEGRRVRPGQAPQ